MQHDERLRAATRAIYETICDANGLAALPFEEAERTRLSLYSRAVATARAVDVILYPSPEQPSLI